MATHYETAPSQTESVHRGDEPEPVHRRPWWLQIGFESGQSAAGCSEIGCDAEGEEPTDLYCSEHQRFLPFAAKRPGKMRWLGVNALRAAAIGMFPIAAELDSPSPLFWLGVLVFGALLVLPLRLYRVTRAAAAVTWLLACLISFAFLLTGSHVVEVVPAVIVGIVLTSLALYLGGLAWTYGRAEPLNNEGVPPRLAKRERNLMELAARTSGRAAGVVAAAAWMTPLALLVLAMITIAPRSLLPWPTANVQVALLGVAVTAAFGALLTALIVGFLHGVGRVDRHVEPWPPLPAPPRRFNFGGARPVRSGGPWGRILSSFELTALRTSEAIANFFASTVHFLIVAFVRGIRWVHRLLTLLGRGILQTVLAMLGVLRDATVIAKAASIDAARVVILPTVCIALAAWLLTIAADDIREYLVLGGLRQLGIATASIAAVVLLANVAWICLSGLNIDRASKSAGRNIELATPQLLALVAVGGWIVGIPGTLGYGRIHVGIVTIGLTVLIISFALWSNRRMRRIQPADAESLS